VYKIVLPVTPTVLNHLWTKAFIYDFIFFLIEVNTKLYIFIQALCLHAAHQRGAQMMTKKVYRMGSEFEIGIEVQNDRMPNYKC
jgi:hypothetical protein